MRKMFKYYADEDLGRSFSIRLPQGAIIRAVNVQNGRGHLWAEVEPDARPIDRTFQVFATGEEIPDLNWHRWTWRGTWQDGPYVWHLFEKEA
jgi:hypothetical protein